MASAKQKKSPSAGRKREPDRVITRADFVGSLMANFMFYLKHNSALSAEDRQQAAKLQAQWDSVCPIRLNNPIIIAELKKEFESGEMK